MPFNGHRLDIYLGVKLLGLRIFMCSKYHHFPKWLYQFTCPLKMHGNSDFFPFLESLGIISPLNSSHSGRSIMDGAVIVDFFGGKEGAVAHRWL